MSPTSRMGEERTDWFDMILRILAKALVIGAGLALCLSWSGSWLMFGDTLAVVRLPLAVGALALAVLVWRWWFSWGVAALAVLAVIGFAWVRMPLSTQAALGDRASDGAGEWAGERSGDGIVLYQKNLLYLRTDRTGFISDVADSGADFITLQEVSPFNRELLEVFAETYPHQQFCPGHGIMGVAILSRWPFTDRHCADVTGMAVGGVNIDGTELRIISLHLSWPWPYTQPDQLRRVLLELDRLPGAQTIIGGDFNMLPEGSSVQRIARAIDGARLGRAERTFELYGYPLAIDHVLATGGQGATEVRPRLGSDHYGVVARVALGN